MKQLGRDNSGSTLLLVIVAMCFIAILGSLLLSLTMTNIQMKQMDYQAKENFYETETVMNELNAGLEELSSRCMYQAYNYIMLHYSEILQDTDTSIKAEFDSRYINYLVSELCGSGVTYDPLDATLYYYRLDVLKGFLVSVPAAQRDNVILATDNELKINLDITDPDKVNSVVLQKVKVSFGNSQGFETRITTDIRLEAPNLNFDSASIYPEFTKYALIADDQLLARDGTGMSVDGNIYAGAGGIRVSATNVTAADRNHSSGYNLMINGDTLITRGDLCVNDYAKLFIGDKAGSRKTNIWAENIRTTGNESGVESAFMDIYGSCRVADDLTLGAKRSVVKISGSYYGYNYNKTNQAVADSGIKSEVNSNYSSAVLINGTQSHLDMSELTSLTIAGRAFISRKNQAGATLVDDIMTGESISVKSNQLAYLVPNEYIWCGHNPVMQTEVNTLSPGQAPVDIPSIPGTISDLLTSRKYVEYHYMMGGTVPMVYYYLEFKNQACANQYFKQYCNDARNKAKLDINSETYLYGDGIKLSGALLLSANGLKSAGDGSLEFTGGVLADPDSPNAALLSDAIRTAREYKSRQLGLVAVSAAGSSGDFRLDKMEKPLFQTLITHGFGGISVIEMETRDDTTAFSNGFVRYQGNYYKKVPIDMDQDGSAEYFVYIVCNSTDITTADIVAATASSSLKPGIIITTGNITVKSNYRGLILSGGMIAMMDNGLHIESDSEMVQNMLSYALEQENKAASDGGWDGNAAMEFTHYFADYAGSSAERAKNIGQVEISRYITYENWKKN
ncbi:MAG TPA: hypothetical protein GXX75_20425 [Clostridiales bacterium]|nr:hypothetical protein [Clostridiales bacterium]